jgi:hypothetical protein
MGIKPIWFGAAVGQSDVGYKPPPPPRGAAGADPRTPGKSQQPQEVRDCSVRNFASPLSPNFGTPAHASSPASRLPPPSASDP